MTAGRVFLTPALLLLIPAPALAHVSGGGIIDSYSGLLHPFTEPMHIITIVALGFMLSQQDKVVPPLGWIGYCVAALGGLILSATGVTGEVNLLYPLAMVLGVIVAMRAHLHPNVCLLLSGLSGIVLGMDSVAIIEGAGKLIVSIFSTTIGLGMALLIVIGWGDYLTRDWQKIGIRVIGSWIAASALLVFTLSLTPH